MIPWVNELNPVFPPADLALSEPNGLLAAGGNLEPHTLLSAYQQGLFPWYSEGEPILWWSPHPRCVIEPKDVHVSKSLKKHLRKHQVSLSFDQAFEEVIYQCSRAESDEDSWITQEMYDAYLRMHKEGHAHSLEVWQEGELTGGLYGLSIGEVFFGESMFSSRTNASKVAFVALCRQLEVWNFRLIDCQVENPHLNSLGAKCIPRNEFLSILKSSTRSSDKTSWQIDPKILGDLQPEVT